MDPACGDGAFLRAAAAVGWAAPEAITGVDVDGAVLAGPVGSNLQTGDGLAPLGTFDAVVGNPPYGGRGVRERSADALVDLGRRYSIHRAGPDGRVGPPKPMPPRFPIATLFVERFVTAARVGGVVALVLPASFLANARDAKARAWLRRRVRLVSIDALGGGVFASTGTRANTAFVVGVRREAETDGVHDPPVLLGDAGGRRHVPIASIDAGGRWDPRFHDPAWDAPLRTLDRPLVPLGEFVAELAYGGILPGAAPTPDAEGVHHVTQRAVTDRGIDLSKCPLIRSEAPWDRPRYRLAPGDLCVPRSGVGTLGRNRLTRFDGADRPAVVDCFTDRLSLRGISSAWVLGFLRSPPGWSQIARTFNGVGTPNISFGEIRGLRVPVPRAAEADEAERLWSAIVAGDRPFEDLPTFVGGDCVRA